MDSKINLGRPCAKTNATSLFDHGVKTVNSPKTNNSAKTKEPPVAPGSITEKSWQRLDALAKNRNFEAKAFFDGTEFRKTVDREIELINANLKSANKLYSEEKLYDASFKIGNISSEIERITKYIGQNAERVLDNEFIAKKCDETVEFMKNLLSEPIFLDFEICNHARAC